MLRAGALFYALAVSLLIALVSSAIILYAYFVRFQFDTLLKIDRLQTNSDSGINLLLSSQQILGRDSERTIDLYGKGEDSITLKRKSWGAFEVVVTHSFDRNLRNTRIAVIGYSFLKEKDIALYLADQNIPLSLSGHTILKGTCYLPKAGVKKSYVNGQAFNGTSLVNGTTKTADSILPALNKEILNSILSLTNNPSDNDSIVSFEELNNADSITQSFNAKTLVIYSISKIVLTNKFFQGNILIKSLNEIVINSSSKLIDVIVNAKKIEVMDGFKGNLQMIADDTLIIGKSCNFYYPSLASVIHNNTSTVTLMEINEGSSLTGIILSYQKRPDLSNRSNVKLEKETIITGEVFSNCTIDLKGKVYGSVYTNRFILRTSSSVYENYLLNAEINRSMLPINYIGIGLLDFSGSRKIAKWL